MSICRCVLFTIISILTVLWPGSAQSDETKAYLFRGAEPGATTSEVLRTDARWGAPQKEERSEDGSIWWIYQPQGYKQAIVTLYGGRVQTIDVFLPEGIGIDEAAAALKLGIPMEDAGLSESARIGAPMPEDWEPVVYSAGRGGVFVDR